MPRQNNFDLLRLIFASMVVLYHCHDLSRSSAYFWIPFIANSRLAVEGFFTMSGCLIIGSYDQHSQLQSYLLKRARRILPAYWAAFGFALVLGSVLSSLPFLAFLRSSATWKWALASLTFANFLHPDLPGLFRHNPFGPTVNGALWTIKVEIMFYLIAPLIVLLCRRFGQWQTLGTLFIFSIAYEGLCERLGHLSLAKQLPGQLCFFVLGALVYYYYPWFTSHRFWMWAGAISSCAVALFSGWITFRAIGVALAVMCVGLLLPSVQGPTKYGDFSYGTYVFHFPVIQTFIALGLVASHPYLSLVLIAFTVGILAVLSWNLVEKRWLRRSVPNVAIASAARHE